MFLSLGCSPWRMNDSLATSLVIMKALERREIAIAWKIL
jgi:hypothetical protein